MQNDNINHPSHYTDGKIEVIDFIEDKNLNFHRGNAVKYIARAGKKDKDKEIERLKEENIALKKDWNRGIDLQRQEAFMEGQKVAIKEFAEKLKINAIYLPYCEITVINMEYIDDLLKEYGIGEENANK